MKSKKCLLSILVLYLLSIIVLIPVKTEAKVTFIKINKTKVTLKTGKSTQLKITENGKKAAATWTSSNKKVATVGKKTGKVQAIKKGTATITGKLKTSVGKRKFSCKVTVKDTSSAKPDTDNNDNDNYNDWQEDEWYDIDIMEDYKVIHSLPASSDSYFPSGFSDYTPDHVDFCFDNIDGKNIVFVYAKNPEGNIERLYYETVGFEGENDYNIWMEKFTHPYMKVVPGKDGLLDIQGVDYK